MIVHEKINAAIRAYVAHEFQHPSPRIFSRSVDQLVAMRELIVASDETGHITPSVVSDVLYELFPVTTNVPSGSAQSVEIERIGNALCEAFRELPRLYKIVINVPGIKVKTGFGYTVSEEIGCFAAAAAAAADLSGQEKSNDGLSGLNIEIRLRGYYGCFEKDALLDSAWSKLRQIAFFLSYSSGGTRGNDPSSDPAVPRLIDDRGREYLLSIPHGLAEFVGQLAYDGEVRVKGQESLGSQLSRLLNYVRSFYEKSGEPARDHERLAAAMEWLVDSLSLSDQTMAYLAACIGLESLLGEDGGDTPTSRLQDRYAYTLGKTRAERKRLASDMHEVFTLRGQLVHARASRLKGKDAASLSKIRRMLALCLGAEVRAYLGDLP